MKKIRVLALLAAFVFLLAGCSRIRAAVRAFLDNEPPSATAEVSGLTDIETDAVQLPDETAVQPDPTEEPAAAIPGAATVTVIYESPMVWVAGLGDGGEELWAREFKLTEETELNPWSDAAIADGAVYLQIGYRMVALDAGTGETIWTSQAGGGLCTPIVRDGVVYTSSYYGEPLIGISAADGTTVFAAPMIDEFYWSHKVEADGDRIIVYFDAAGPDQGKGTALFELDGTMVSKTLE